MVKALRRAGANNAARVRVAGNLAMLDGVNTAGVAQTMLLAQRKTALKLERRRLKRNNRSGALV